MGELQIEPGTPELSVNEFAHLGLDAQGQPLPEEPVEAPAETPEPMEGHPPEPTEAEKAAEAERKEKSDRYRELILRRKEAEAAAERERAERERLQQELEALKTQPKGEPGNPRPRLEEFDTVEAWQEADTKWLEDFTERRFTERERVASERAQQERVQSEFKAAVQSFEKAEESYKSGLGAKAGEYDRATENLKLFTNGNPTFVKALLNTSPEVVHAVGEDVELADRLSRADPLTLGLELGRLQAKVQDKGRQGRRFSQVSAPEPIVSGGRAGGQRDYSQLSGDEYAKVRDAEESKKRETLRASRRW